MKQKRTKKTRKNFIYENYRKSFDYIKDSRNYIYFVIGIFLIFILVGFFVPAPPVIYEKIIEFIKEILEKTQGMDFFELTRFIFLNNLKVGFFGIVLGLLFGVIPIVLVISNGYLLGFVASLTASEEGIWTLWRILPHGIFELPAVFISMALGLKLGLYLFLEERGTFYEQVKNTAKVFVFVVIPLLIIAAIIESYLISLSS